MTGIVSYAFFDRDGILLHHKNEEMLLTPASNMKIVSGFAAYSILGPDFNFKTQFYTDGNELCVDGDPTPLLNGPELIKIGKNIEKQNIKHIKINNSALDEDYYGRGWAIDDNSYSYQTKIASFSVNEGCIPGRIKKMDLSTLTDVHEKFSSPVKNQSKFFEKCLWEALSMDEKNKLNYNEMMIFNREESFTQSLKDVIKHVETFSCNFTAEVLTKYLSYSKKGAKGNWKDSIEIIGTLLKKMGYSDDQFRIADGSGLSRLNLLSANLLGSLINKIEKSGNAKFLDLLPEPGTGTLKNRLLEFKDLGIHAKTGSVSYCSSLTGYISKYNVSFSIIVNNSTDNPENLSNSVDSILKNFLSEFIRS